MKVLIADEDAAVRESLSVVLKGAGYETVLAGNGQEAVNLFDPEKIDFLLLDLSLPIRDGWETFEKITRMAPELPIIIITSKVDQYNTALAAGVGALMEKPLDVMELLQTIEVMLAEPKEVRLRRLCGYSHNARFIPAVFRSGFSRYPGNIEPRA